MRPVFIILLLLTGGCVTTGSAATDAEKDEVDEALLACLKKAAVKLDDGISGAATIGMAINSFCYLEAEQRVNVYVKGKNRRVTAMVTEGFREINLDLATRVVLTYRSQ
jgi:hypothetical protein